MSDEAQRTQHKQNLLQASATPSAQYNTQPFYSLNGRIGRLHYLAYGFILTALLFMILAALLTAAAGILVLIVNEESTWAAGMPHLFSSIILLTITLGPPLIYMTLARRRLHDMNVNGWVSLLFLVPVINILFWLYLLFAPGDSGVNHYGLPATPPSALMKGVAHLAALVIVCSFIGSIQLFIST